MDRSSILRASTSSDNRAPRLRRRGALSCMPRAPLGAGGRMASMDEQRHETDVDRAVAATRPRPRSPSSGRSAGSTSRSRPPRRSGVVVDRRAGRHVVGPAPRDDPDALRAPDGRPDAYGSKLSLLCFRSSAIAIYVGLTVASAYPRVFNMPWRVTEENRIAQYRTTATFLRFIKAWIVWLFAYSGLGERRRGLERRVRALFGPWFVVPVGAAPRGGSAAYLCRHLALPLTARPERRSP